MSLHDRVRHGRLLAAAALALVWLASGAAAADKLAGFHAAAESITGEDLQKHVEFLAAPEREGREAGTRGGQAAGTYVADQLAALRLRGAGSNGGYFQHFAPNSRNVLALLEGRDPELKNQVIVVGAHYDHVGYGRSGGALGEVGLIHPGADDNASGTAGVLELARAFSRLPQSPRRSILFAFWDAEEKGMLGSRHWVDNPTLPLDRVVLLVNFDMIGRLRNDRLTLFGSHTGYGLRRLASTHNDPPLLIDFRRAVVPQADHTPFYESDIPVLVFHTGMHPQYHRAGDSAALTNATGMERVVRLVFGVVCDAANRDQAPRFREASRGEPERPPTEIAPLPPVNGPPLRVGVTWRSDDAEPGTAVVIRVAADSPASRAGLRPGDRIYQVAGRDFADENQVFTLLTTLPGPIKLLVEREGHLQTVEIRLAAAPQRRAA